MSLSLFTVVCDYDGGTYVWQTRAANVDQAVHDWAMMVRTENPMPKSSTAIAVDVFQQLEEFGAPTLLSGLSSAWQLGGVINRLPYTATIIETA